MWCETVHICLAVHCIIDNGVLVLSETTMMACFAVQCEVLSQSKSAQKFSWSKSQ